MRSVEDLVAGLVDCRADQPAVLDDVDAGTRVEEYLQFVTGRLVQVLAGVQ